MADDNEDWFSPPPAAAQQDVLYLDLDGWEGPLDLLLELARRQKVDLAGISVLSLAEQYLAFIETLRDRRIEIAADYLVMAAWLAYLKSRLMVPGAPGDEEPTGEMMAAMLQFRLRRLEAMRRASQQLMNRPRLGLAVHQRGDPEIFAIERRAEWDASLYDLLKAYAAIRERNGHTDYVPRQRNVWALGDAREILERLIGASMDWMPLDAYLAEYLVSQEDRATVLASSFASSLELVRLGNVEVRQHAAFGPLLLRRRARDTPGGAT